MGKILEKKREGKRPRPLGLVGPEHMCLKKKARARRSRVALVPRLYLLFF